MKESIFTIEVEGVTPLIIHNSRTANPLDPYYKKLKEYTSKRKKTEEDHEEILKIQWESALYWSDSLGLFMPFENIYAHLLRAAKKHKLGPKIGAISFDEPIGFPIITKNHDNLKKLKADEENKFVKLVNIQRSKTLSCRPIFRNWAINFSFTADMTQIDANEVKTILLTAANQVGLGVWRPSSPQPGPYGKYMIKSFKYVDQDNNIKTVGELK